MSKTKLIDGKMATKLMVEKAEYFVMNTTITITKGKTSKYFEAGSTVAVSDPDFNLLLKLGALKKGE